MSRLCLYFHIVWTTKCREPLLTPPKEAAVYRCILKLMAKHESYTVLALNGMPDHVHLLLQTGAQIDLAALMKTLKGVTSAMVNDMTDHAERFRWQEGYFAATVTPSHLPKVLEYVKNQKQRHASGNTHSAWEETGETTEVEVEKDSSD